MQLYSHAGRAQVLSLQCKIDHAHTHRVLLRHTHMHARRTAADTSHSHSSHPPDATQYPDGSFVQMCTRTDRGERTHTPRYPTHVLRDALPFQVLLFVELCSFPLSYATRVAQL